MRVLITGAGGQLGSAIEKLLTEHCFQVFATNSDQVDVSLEQSVMAIEAWKPEFIVNAAAYTMVDKAEEEPEKAFAVNDTGIQNLIKLASKLCIPLVTFSTDYVFSGDKRKPYVESDHTGPIGIYGLSKLAGEKALAKSDIIYINIRTSWIFGEHGNNFVKTMLGLAKNQKKLSIVEDQIGCPTYTGDLALLTLKILHMYGLNSGLPKGDYHYCGGEPVSWYCFAKEIFIEARLLGMIDSIPKLEGIPTSAYSTLAKRPIYSVMNCEKVETVFSVYPSNWRNALKKMLRAIK